MFQFLLPLLAALGMGGGTAAGLGATGLTAGSALTAPALMGGAGGLTSGLAGLTAGAAPALGPTLGAAAGLSAPTGVGAALSKFAPNLMGMGKNLMGGNLQGAGANLGNMMGGKTLGDMIANPSWANLSKMGEGMGDKMAMAMLTGGNQPSQQQQMGPGAIETKQRISTPEPEIEDPILKRMYQNLNQPQGFQAPTMQSWGQSPYPRRMSPI